MEIVQAKAGVFRLKTKSAQVVLEQGVTIATTKEPFVITEPGEYEVEGVSVFGVNANSRVVFMVQAEGLRVLYIPSLTQELSEAYVEELGRIDVVIVPVVAAGTEGELDYKGMIRVIERLEPTYILPFASSAEVTSLVTAYEHGSREVDKLVVAAATMPTDVTEVVVLAVKA